MKDGPQIYKQQHDPKRFLRRVADTYFFNRASGLYQPECDHAQKEIAPNDAHKLPESVLIRLENSSSWVSNLIALAAVLVSFLTLILLGFTAYFAAGQWKEMKRAADATAQASQTATCALRENQRQFNETLGQMRGQTKAQKETAETAKETLRVSERAYLSVGGPAISGKPLRLSMPIFNTGHIPAKNISFLAFEETDTGPAFSQLLEGHWSQWELKEEISPTSSGNSLFSITLGSGLADTAEVEKGTQIILVAGAVEYNYGFPNTPNETTWFCFHSQYDDGSKTNRFIPCDTQVIIEAIKKAIQYPNNYQPAYR